MRCYYLVASRNHVHGRAAEYSSVALTGQNFAGHCYPWPILRTDFVVRLSGLSCTIIYKLIILISNINESAIFKL